jgi:hypothetical protein
MAQSTLSLGGERITGILNQSFRIKLIFSCLYYLGDSVRTQNGL